VIILLIATYTENRYFSCDLQVNNPQEKNMFSSQKEIQTSAQQKKNSSFKAGSQLASRIGFALLLSLSFAACSKDVSLELSTVGDTMAYDKTTLTVKPGATVKLHFKNNATSQAMQHNFILVNPGKDSDVAMAGLSAGASKDFIPESPEIIAHTKLLKPGEEDHIYCS